MKRSFRRHENATVIQGAKNIRLLLDHGIQLSKIGATVPDVWNFPEQVQDPSNDLIRNPKSWPADKYYVNGIDVVRKFMGPSSQPGRHELWAEVAINKLPASTMPQEENINRVLILEGFRNDRDVGELIRTARGLAWDAGFLCESDKLDVYSPEALRASRLQTVFFPTTTALSKDALSETKEWGCTPIFLTPLPDAQLSESEVGRPHFWRTSKKTVDLEEIKGQKIALVASQKENSNRSSDDICLSIPLANSSTSPYQELATLSVVQATAMAMMALLNITQDVKLSQPTGLRPSHPEEAEGRIVTKALAKILKVPRPLTARQAAMKAKREAREKFVRNWEEAEKNFGKDDENWEGWEEVDELEEEGNEAIPGKIGSHRKRLF